MAICEGCYLSVMMNWVEQILGISISGEEWLVLTVGFYDGNLFLQKSHNSSGDNTECQNCCGGYQAAFQIHDICPPLEAFNLWL